MSSWWGKVWLMVACPFPGTGCPVPEVGNMYLIWNDYCMGNCFYNCLPTGLVSVHGKIFFFEKTDSGFATLWCLELWMNHLPTVWFMFLNDGWCIVGYSGEELLSVDIWISLLCTQYLWFSSHIFFPLMWWHAERALLYKILCTAVFHRRCLYYLLFDSDAVH